MSKKGNSVVQRAISIILAVLIIGSVLVGNGIKAFAASSIGVTIDGKQVELTQSLVIQDGRTLVPLRAIFEAMGMTVSWDQATQRITATNDTVTIKLTVGNNVATVGNDKSGYIYSYLDVAPQVINGSTLVPVRYIGESTGYDISWNSTTSTVVMTSNSDRIFTSGDNTKIKFIGYYSSTKECIDGLAQLTAVSNGVTYTLTGAFSDGQLNGYGVMVNGDDSTYIGNFVNSEPSGQGTMTGSKGQSYVGAYEDGMPNGYGSYTESTGNVYIGTFKNGKLNGYGECYNAEGDIYKGQWTNGVPNGYGSFYEASTGKTYTGTWSYGIMVSK